MIFGDIYKDVYSRLNIPAGNPTIFASDIISAINEAIALERIERIRNGNGDSFAVTETFFFTVQDVIEYRYAYTVNLENEICSELPLHSTILSASASVKNDESGVLYYVYNNESYTKVKETTDQISATNTFSKSVARNFRVGNGLKYKANDVIYDFDTQEYFRVVQDIVASTQEVTDVNYFTPLYYSKHGTTFSTPSVVEYEKLHTLKMYNDIPETYALTVRGDVLYVSKNCKQLTLTYIPEWVAVEDATTEIKMPFSMKPGVIMKSLALLESKSTKNLVDNRYIKPQDTNG